MMSEPLGTDVPFEGVEALDHTADVGLRIHGETLAVVLERAALGMTHLILEGPLPGATEERPVEVGGPGPEGLLRNWLREILFLHEAEGFAVAVPRVRHVKETEDGEWLVEATLGGGDDPSPPAREIKGVTWHGLRAEERGGGWDAQVIFDV